MSSELRVDKIIPTGGIPTGGGGGIIQVVESADFSSQTSTTSTTFQDTSLTATITPKFNTSKILVLANGDAFVEGTANNVYGEIRLVRGSTEIARIDHGYDAGGSLAARLGLNFSINKLDSPNTTSATTYKIQIRVQRTNYSATIKFPTLHYGSATEKYVGQRIHLYEVSA